MVEARFVQLEGVETRCLLVCPDANMPEELVIDFSRHPPQPDREPRGQVTFRLQPSSIDQAEPVYVEIFDD